MMQLSTATDNLPGRYLINDACILQAKPDFSRSLGDDENRLLSCECSEESIQCRKTTRQNLRDEPNSITIRLDCLRWTIDRNRSGSRRWCAGTESTVAWRRRWWNPSKMLPHRCCPTALEPIIRHVRVLGRRYRYRWAYRVHVDI